MRSDETDWTDFLRRHHAALTAYAVSLTGNLDDARELIQEVLCRLVVERRSMRSAKPFVMRCLRNLAIDRHRATARRGNGAMPAMSGTAFLDPAVGDAEQRETTERIRAALDRLPEARREAIVLRVYGGLTIRETSEVLGRPIGTVASDYARGIDALRSLSEEQIDHVRS